MWSPWRCPKYPRSTENATPFRLLAQDGQHTYVAQSGLIGPDGVDSSGERPLYTTLRSEYRLDNDDDELAVELHHETAAGVEVIKRYRFETGSYAFDVEHEIKNGSDADVRARLFAQLKRDDSTPEEEGFQMGPRPYVGAALTTPEDRYNKVDFDDVDDAEFRADVTGGWVAMLQHYFVVAWVANPEELNAYTGRRLGRARPAPVCLRLRRARVPGRAWGEASGRRQALCRAEGPGSPRGHRRKPQPHRGLRHPLVVGGAAVPGAGLHPVMGDQLGRCHPASDAGDQAGAVSALGHRLSLRCEDAARGAAAQAPAGAPCRRSPQAVGRDDGTLPPRGCQPVRRLLADAAADAVFFALYWVLYESVELRQRRSSSGSRICR